MTLKIIHRLHAFANAIRRTFVQHFTFFRLTVCSHGFSVLAELLVRNHNRKHGIIVILSHVGIGL